MKAESDSRFVPTTSLKLETKSRQTKRGIRDKESRSKDVKKG